MNLDFSPFEDGRRLWTCTDSWVEMEVEEAGETTAAATTSWYETRSTLNCFPPSLLLFLCDSRVNLVCRRSICGTASAFRVSDLKPVAASLATLARPSHLSAVPFFLKRMLSSFTANSFCDVHGSPLGFFFWFCFFCLCRQVSAAG